MATPPRIAVVLVNWNRAPDTIECLESLRAAALGNKVSLAVVDNGSSDESADAIWRWAEERLPGLERAEVPGGSAAALDLTSGTWPFLYMIRSPENRGFAAGSNLGIRACLARTEVDWVWVLNNDTVVERAALAALERCASEPGAVGIIGSTIVEYLDRTRIQVAGGFRHNYLLGKGWPAMHGRSVDEIRSAPAPRIDHVAGTAMLMRADMLRRVGLLNEEYFLYFEELDYTLRAQREGFRSVWCRESLVFHKGGVSAGSKSLSAQKSVSAEYHSDLSALKFTRRHRPALFPLFAVVRFFAKLLHHVGTGNPRLIKPLIDAYRDFMRST